MSFLRIGTLFLVLALCIQFSKPVYAQDKVKKSENVIKIAVLNLEQIRRKAIVIKGIHKQISNLEKEIKEGVQREEDALRKGNQDLAKKRAILAPEAYTQERKKFEQSVLTLWE